MLGVARETVRDWFTNNGGPAKGSKPDARVKLSPNAETKVVEDVWDGMSQAQVAANCGDDPEADDPNGWPPPAADTERR